MEEFWLMVNPRMMDPRRRKEVSDSNMVHEDPRAMANLPTEGYQRVFRSRNIQKSPIIDDEIGMKRKR